MRGTVRLAALLLSASIGAQELRTVPVFRHGIIADSVGIANLPVADIDGDGIPDVISCSQGAPNEIIVVSSGATYVYDGATQRSPRELDRADAAGAQRLGQRRQQELRAGVQ